jgi:cellulose synthase/poly-beta-1,6-N-acetylglucosamine synthase-like glycosyltransferase
VCIPATVLFGEVLAAVSLRRRRAHHTGVRPGLAVLVPAHDESSNCLATIDDIKRQLRPGDRLLVVADNCTDDTAAVAAAAGAEVVERSDPERIGKGYALDFGIAHLAVHAPEVVIIVDADCRLAEGALDRLAQRCAAAGRPVQALYLMHAADHSPITHRVAEFAWSIKNEVRPLGLAALGFPCQLMGTGMALPWEAVQRVDLASGHIVEDLKLGIDLALAKRPPLFCPDARVTSTFPLSDAATQSQRTRWEQGHLGLIFSTAPRLLARAIVRRDLQLLMMALDLAVPPLVLLMLLLVAILAATAIGASLGASAVPLGISLAAAALFSIALMMAWACFGRTILPLRSFPELGAYLLAKLGLYGRLAAGGHQTRWVRTDRE